MAFFNFRLDADSNNISLTVLPVPFTISTPVSTILSALPATLPNLANSPVPRLTSHT